MCSLVLDRKPGVPSSYSSSAVTGTPRALASALIVLSDERRYTLPVALANLLGEHVQDVELMMAGSVLTVMPVLVVFLFLQRYYVRGIMAGSVKG